MTGPPEFEGFADIDRTGRTASYADYLDQVRGLEAVAEWKERSFAALAPRPGAVLVDVGCGTGEDVRTLARLVAPGGRAIGVDASEAMVAEARRRADAAGEAAVEFLRSDVRSLPLPDAAVNGCRAERVLQHLEDAGRGDRRDGAGRAARRRRRRRRARLGHARHRLRRYGGRRRGRRGGRRPGPLGPGRALAAAPLRSTPPSWT